MDTKLPIYDAKILGSDNTGIFAMSFVDFPANESNFVALKSVKTTLSFDKKKQILTGVVLKPDQLIYRNDDKLGEYYVKWSAPEIEKIAQKMMRTGVALSTTTHQHEKPLKGNYLTELWIVENPKIDKSVALGLGELPKGTLVASYKIEDAHYWRTKVMAGVVKGFSLEGFFNFNSVKMSKPQMTPKAAATALGKKTNPLATMLHSMAAFLEGDSAAATDALADEAKKDEVDAGEPYLIFELADGSEIYVDPDGFATLDDAQAPAGEHALKDGNFIVIDDAGMLVTTQEEPEAEEPAKAEAALKKAKERAKTFLAKRDGAPPPSKAATPKAKEIAKLEAQIAKLKAEPSADKAKPPVNAAAVQTLLEKDVKDLTQTEKIARILLAKRQAEKNN